MTGIRLKVAPPGHIVVPSLSDMVTAIHASQRISQPVSPPRENLRLERSNHTTIRKTLQHEFQDFFVEALRLAQYTRSHVGAATKHVRRQGGL